MEPAIGTLVKNLISEWPLEGLNDFATDLTGGLEALDFLANFTFFSFSLRAAFSSRFFIGLFTGEFGFSFTAIFCVANGAYLPLDDGFSVLDVFVGEAGFGLAFAWFWSLFAFAYVGDFASRDLVTLSDDWALALSNWILLGLLDSLRVAFGSLAVNFTIFLGLTVFLMVLLCGSFSTFLGDSSFFTGAAWGLLGLGLGGSGLATAFFSWCLEILVERWSGIFFSGFFAADLNGDF